MLDRLSLRIKIFILCIILSSLSVFIATFAFKGFNDIEKSNAQVVEKIVPNMNLANTLALHYRSIRINLRTLGISGLSAEEGNKAIEDTLISIKDFEKVNLQFLNMQKTAEEQILYDKLNSEWIKFRKIGEEAIGYYQTGKEEDKEKMLNIFLIHCPDAAEKFAIPLMKLLSLYDSNLKKYRAESNMISQQTNNIIVIVSVVGIGVGIGIGIVFSQNAMKLSNSIGKIAYTLKDSVEEVSSAAVQIASSSAELSNSTRSQAASLQETSASIEEISAMISSNTMSAGQSATFSEESLLKAEQGKIVVAKMMDATNVIDNGNNDIINQVDISNKEIEDIINLINEISSKTKIINDIVFQTKLLSFNASVEAARAGDHGKGFSVVAEEIGNLASVSGEASIEISKMLEDSVKRVDEIILNQKKKINSLVQENKKNVDTGLIITSECKKLLDEIVMITSRVSKEASQIAVASKEQSLGVVEVTKAVTLLDGVTQRINATALESASASKLLSDQAARLSSAIDELVSTIEGRKKVV